MKARSFAIRFEVAVMQPAPPLRSSGSISGSAPARTEKPGKRSTSASMFASSPAESLMPTNTSGKRARSRSMSGKVIGTAEACGMWYSTTLSQRIGNPLDHLGVGGEQPVLGDALVVEGGQHHHRVDAEREGVPCQLHGLGQRRHAG